MPKKFACCFLYHRTAGEGKKLLVQQCSLTQDRLWRRQQNISHWMITHHTTLKALPLLITVVLRLCLTNVILLVHYCKFPLLTQQVGTTPVTLAIYRIRRNSRNCGSRDFRHLPRSRTDAANFGDLSTNNIIKVLNSLIN